MLRPDGDECQGDKDSHLDFEEAMKRNDPCGVRTRNEHDDSKGDARVTIRSFLHAKCSAQKSQHKYCGREDKKIFGKPGRQERSSESTQRGSGNAFDRN